MSIGAIFIGLALLVLVIPIVSDPFRERAKRLVTTRDGKQTAGLTHEQVLMSLRELDFDYQTDKISADDFQLIRSQLMLQAAATLQSEQVKDERIEEMIQSRKESHDQPGSDPPFQQVPSSCSCCGTESAESATHCSACGHKNVAGDRFCSHCGNLLKPKG